MNKAALTLTILLILAAYGDGVEQEEEVPAGSSREGSDPPRWRAWIASAEAEVEENLTNLQAAEKACTNATSSASTTKAEAGFVRAQDRLNDSRNRLASLASSYAQISSAQGLREAPATSTPSEDKNKKSKSDPSLSKFIKRKLPEPKDGWRDASGKPHHAHGDMSSFLCFIYWILWQLHDAVTDNVGEDTGDPEKQVSLCRQTSQEALEQSDDLTPKSLIEVALNEIHEYAHNLYLRHCYNPKVADAFKGDDLFAADRTVPTGDRVTSALKRVQKSGASTSSNSKTAKPGGGRGGGRSRGGRGGGGRGYMPYPVTFPPMMPPQGLPPLMPPRGPPKCFVCAGAHFARDCPNKK